MHDYYRNRCILRNKSPYGESDALSTVLDITPQYLINRMLKYKP